MKSFSLLLAFIFLYANLSHACSMYKITRDGKTIVGNNEDYLSPNTKMWFEPGGDGEYGIMNIGFLNNFAQGGINEAGLVFDGFAMPYKEVKNTEGKINIPIGQAVKKAMHSYSTVREVKTYFSTINLSALASGMVVFVDRSGEYLIVEGDELIIGNEAEHSFSNFYPSDTKNRDAVEVPHYQKGMEYIRNSNPEFSVDYCANVMNHLSQKGVSEFSVLGTMYSAVYDLEKLTIRFFHQNDFEKYVDVNLKDELKKGAHNKMIPDLFPQESTGYQVYLNYNDEKKPAAYVKSAWEKDSHGKSGEELENLGQVYASFINTIGYEWLYQKNNPKGAIAIFKYGTELFPKNANLFDSLGEGHFEDGNYEAAILNYEKSLELNPQNENAENMIAELKNSKTEYVAENTALENPTELELITQALMDYIDGTANGEPDRISRAFHSDLNLYTVDNGELVTRSGQKYISYFQEGKKNNRIGKIISIDFENDAAMAKIEVDMPGMKRVYTDYLLLLKLNGGWKIIHKSYTYREYRE